VSRVDAFKCDYCGKESRERAGWVSIAAACTASHDRSFNAHQIQATAGRSEVVVRFIGRKGFEFTTADLCSVECAGAFIFDNPRPKP
jgi:hypothetical protein